MYALPWEPLGMALRRRQNACDSTCPGRGAPPHAMMLLIPSFLPALPCLAVPVGALRSTPTNTRNMTTKTSCAWLTKQRGRLSVLCDKSWYLVQTPVLFFSHDKKKFSAEAVGKRKDCWCVYDKPMKSKERTFGCLSIGRLQ
ncbi:hypothetical protein GW17_00042724 [Ensete ventricosum]|nr:hypothetical protein GW17_00042724 [Ensete ventricosum]